MVKKNKLLDRSFQKVKEQIEVQFCRYCSHTDLKRFSPQFQNEVKQHFADMSREQVYDALNS